MTTGELIEGAKGWMKCVDCGTQYPILEYMDNGEIKEGIRCNGHTIELCPWCRPDSMPWMHGRGA